MLSNNDSHRSKPSQKASDKPCRTLCLSDHPTWGDIRHPAWSPGPGLASSSPPRDDDTPCLPTCRRRYSWPPGAHVPGTHAGQWGTRGCLRTNGDSPRQNADILIVLDLMKLDLRISEHPIPEAVLDMCAL